MGLDIIGKKTGHHLSGGYSRLHHTARYLALLWCGMPDSIGEDNEGKPVDSMCFYMHPFVWKKNLDTDKLNTFIHAIQVSGYYFPNLLIHSDCEGNYTKNGPDAVKSENLMKGNSIKLLAELNILCEDKELLAMAENNEKIKNAFDYTIKFRNLVKDEIENGVGTILFR